MRFNKRFKESYINQSNCFWGGAHTFQFVLQLFQPHVVDCLFVVREDFILGRSRAFNHIEDSLFVHLVHATLFCRVNSIHPDPEPELDNKLMQINKEIERTNNLRTKNLFGFFMGCNERITRAFYWRSFKHTVSVDYIHQDLARDLTLHMAIYTTDVFEKVFVTEENSWSILRILRICVQKVHVTSSHLYSTDNSHPSTVIY